MSDVIYTASLNYFPILLTAKSPIKKDNHTSPVFHSIVPHVYPEVYIQASRPVRGLSVRCKRLVNFTNLVGCDTPECTTSGIYFI